MPRNLFILSNNTHYSIAKKFLKENPNNDNLLIITLKEFKNYEKFIEQVQKEGYFNSIYVIKARSQLKVIWNIIYLIFISLKIGQIDYLFLSSYYQWIQHYIISLIDFKKIILLNDGANIFSIVELRRRVKDINFQIKNHFVKKIIKLPSIERLTYFTQFDLDLASSSDDQITFGFDRNAKANLDKNLLFFIGSPLVESHIVSADFYLKVLQNLKDRNRDKIIFYFAHRRESNSNLDTYSSIFDKVVTNNAPFEEYILNAKKLPSTIVSFYSTVILNLFPLYKEINFYSHEIQSEQLTIGDFKKKRIIKLYDDMKLIKAQNFRVIRYDY